MKTPKPPLKPTLDSGRRTVLVAVTGKASPILTEALWALARTRDFPNRLVVVTTQDGRQEIINYLFTRQGETEQFPGRTVWEALLTEVESLLGEAPPREICSWGPHLKQQLIVAGQRTEDVRDRKRAVTFGGTLFDTIERYKSNGWRVVACMAGARKQMEYLLYGTMSFLATDDDRLLTVTVDPERWARAEPRFYFPPSQPTRHRLPNPAFGNPKGHPEVLLSSEKARVQLVDVPFPIHSPSEVGKARGHSGARDRFKSALLGYDPDRNGISSIRIDVGERQLVVDDVCIRLSPTEMAVYCFLAARAVFGSYPRSPKPMQLVNDFDEWLRDDHVLSVVGKQWDGIDTSSQTLSKALNGMRQKIGRGVLWSLQSHVLPSGHGGTAIPYPDLIQNLPPSFVDAVRLIEEMTTTCNK